MSRRCSRDNIKTKKVIKSEETEGNSRTHSLSFSHTLVSDAIDSLYHCLILDILWWASFDPSINCDILPCVKHENIKLVVSCTQRRRMHVRRFHCDHVSFPLSTVSIVTVTLKEATVLTALSFSSCTFLFTFSLFACELFKWRDIMLRLVIYSLTQSSLFPMTSRPWFHSSTQYLSVSQVTGEDHVAHCSSKLNRQPLSDGQDLFCCARRSLLSLPLTHSASVFIDPSRLSSHKRLASVCGRERGKILGHYEELHVTFTPQFSEVSTAACKHQLHWQKQRYRRLKGRRMLINRRW